MSKYRMILSGCAVTNEEAETVAAIYKEAVGNLEGIPGVDIEEKVANVFTSVEDIDGNSLLDKWATCTQSMSFIVTAPQEASRKLHQASLDVRTKLKEQGFHEKAVFYGVVPENDMRTPA